VVPEAVIVLADTLVAVSAPADAVARVLDPATLSALPTYTLLATPRPPETCAAPVSVELASVVADASKVLDAVTAPADTVAIVEVPAMFSAPA
jgi:hypothetical protein